MPNTKSAERRMRNSARKRLENKTIKSRLKTLEGSYLELVGSGKKTEALSALRGVVSALDKAVKHGVVHHRMADRKKSRLTLRLNRLAG